MFTVEQRDRVQEHVLALAEADDRVVAGAVVGGMALGPGDRWSDLDLTFGVADGVPLAAVLDDWTRDLDETFGAAHLFDLPAHTSIYRVLLLQGCLQVDLSFTPAADFGAHGPRFALLFGTAVEHPAGRQQPARDLFGLAVHHAVRARVCVERGRFWQAEHWIAGVREQALVLACRRRGLDGSHGRGFDDLPAEVLEPLRGALIGSLERTALLRALETAVAALLRESDDAGALPAQVEAQLRGIAS